MSRATVELSEQERPSTHDRLAELRREAHTSVKVLGWRATARRIGISEPTLRRFVNEDGAEIAPTTWQRLGRWTRDSEALAPEPRTRRRHRIAAGYPDLEEMRTAVRTAAAVSTYRTLALEIGVKHAALHNFATGQTVPYNRLGVRLRAWYTEVWGQRTPSAPGPTS